MMVCRGKQRHSLPLGWNSLYDRHLVWRGGGLSISNLSYLWHRYWYSTLTG
jgi:hypothetical protein